MPEWEELLSEVSAFVSRNRDAYVGLISDLVGEINQIKHQPECSGFIYSVYSRADKQGGEELKENWKIAKKFGQYKREDAAISINDIHDIVGITIVVNFPSDRSVVADYISRKNVLRCATVYHSENKEDNGYHAVHLRVRGATIERSFLRAEIQIKTMLHDGWGAKTHDLTYKPEGAIEDALLKHMAILGDVLRRLDDQSELIKDAIRKKWRDDTRYREVAQDALIRSMLSLTDSSNDREIAKSLRLRKRSRITVAPWRQPGSMTR